jgi:hypothetical protein
MLPGVNKKNTKNKLHVCAQNGENKIKFSSLVQVSARNISTCQRHGKSSTVCACKNIANKILDISSEGEVKDEVEYHEDNFAISYKPRAASLNRNGAFGLLSMGHFSPYQNPPPGQYRRSFPDTAVPGVICTCSNTSGGNLPYPDDFSGQKVPCMCRVRCLKCDGEWGNEEFVCFMEVHCVDGCPVTIPVYCRRCTGLGKDGSICEEILNREILENMSQWTQRCWIMQSARSTKALKV